MKPKEDAALIKPSDKRFVHPVNLFKFGLKHQINLLLLLEDRQYKKINFIF